MSEGLSDVRTEPLTLDDVARAIDPDAFADHPGHRPGECKFCDDTRKGARDAARRVLLAIRDPDPMMVFRGFMAAPIPPMRAMPRHYRFAWRAMVDELLK